MGDDELKRLLILLVAALLVACGGKAVVEETQEEQEEKIAEDDTDDTESGEGSIEVEKNLLSVEITLPKEFLEMSEEPEQDPGDNEIAKIIERDDGKVTENEDG